MVIKEAPNLLANPRDVFEKPFPPVQEIERDRRIFVDELGKTTRLLKIFDYTILSSVRLGEKQTIALVKTIEDETNKRNDGYPRYHMILQIPVRTGKLEIINFHVDKKRHKILYDSFPKKFDEIMRLIKGLSKEEESIARNNLLNLLTSKLLFGDLEGLEGLGELKREIQGKRLIGRGGQRLTNASENTHRRGRKREAYVLYRGLETFF